MVNTERKKVKLNDYVKEIIFKSAVLFVLLFIVLLVLSVVLYAVQSTNLIKNYNYLLKYNSENVVKKINEIIQSNYDGKTPEYHIYNNYNETGVIELDGSFTQLDYNQKKYIDENDFVFSTYYDLTSGNKNERDIYLIDCREKSNLAFYKISSILKDFNISHHAFITAQGSIVCSDINLGTGVEGFFSHSEWQRVDDVNGKTIEINDNGNKLKCLLVSEKITKDFYYLAIHDISVASNELNENLKTIILILSLLFILLYTICIIYIIDINSSKLKMIKRKNRENFAFYVVTDNDGNVLKSNDYFKNHYENKNIFEKILVRSTVMDIIAGDNLWVTLTDLDGKKHIVNLLAVSSGRKFEFIGSAEDPFIEARGEIETEKDESVTNLAYNVDFSRRFEQERESKRRVLFGIFEITNLKVINEMFGESFAERLENIIIERIKRDFKVIHLFSDKTIGIMVTGDIEISDIQRDLLDIMNRINRPIQIDYDVVLVSVMCGFALVDNQMAEADYSYAQRCAHAALKRCKKEINKNNYYLYHESQKKFYSQYFDYNYNIEQLLANNNFEVQYQPQYNIEKNRITGFEALFRIKRTSKVNVSVYDFITYAERTGKMTVLGKFIFSEGMKFAKSIEGMGVSVSLNVSPIQLLQAGFVNDFLDLYRSFNLQPNSICIEVTESFIMYDMKTIMQKLIVLHNNGIAVHLDDFGTSYSSLAYVRKLPIDVIKIDKSFVDDIVKDEQSAKVIKFIVELADELGLESLAEGVETVEQLNKLKELGCNSIQGYLIGKAKPSEEAIKMIKDNFNIDNLILH